MTSPATVQPKALTIRQPWAFAIAEGFKTTENRSRRTNHRGPVLIHAGQTHDRTVPVVRYSRDAAIRLDDLGGSGNFWNAIHHIPSKVVPPPPASLALSAIIATARIVDCHQDTGCCRPWGFADTWHWVLADVTALSEPVPCKGRLGLWTPSADILASVTAQTIPQRTPR